MPSGRPPKKKRPGGGPPRRKPGQKKGPQQGPSGWRVARADGKGWKLVEPKSISERDDDIAEVRQMIDGGEAEIAADELRWLLSDCPDHLAAHALLGELAAAANDLQLARAHFGYAFQIGEKTLKTANCSGPLLGSEPGNGAWHDAALGLAWALEKQGEAKMADNVCATALRYDPTDPAGVRAMLDELRSGGLPMVSLG